MGAYKWVLGSVQQAMAKLSRSLSPIFVGAPVAAQGNRKPNMSGVPAGGVAWPVDPSKHDDNSFIGADCFIAEYKHATKTVHALDEIAKPANPLQHVPIAKPAVPHPGADPLTVDVNVRLASEVNADTLGIVVRTAEYGTAGLAKNVFFPMTMGQLIAQHIFDGPNAGGPDLSSKIREPSAAGGTIDGTLNDTHIVRREPSQLRGVFDDTGSGQPGVPTQPTPIPQPVPTDRPTAMIHGSASPFIHGGAFPSPPYYRGFMPVFFINAIGVMSWLKGGPLTHCRHSRLSFARTDPTQAGPGTPGPNSADQWFPGSLAVDATFSGSAAFEGPLDLADELEGPVGGSSGFLTRVFCLFDTKDKFAPKGGALVLEKNYPNLGPRRGVRRWSIRLPFTEVAPGPGSLPLPPSGEKPEGEKPEDDKKKKREIYFDGNPSGGGTDGIPYPNIHKLAR
jgi:hypothetical protein